MRTTLIYTSIALAIGVTIGVLTRDNTDTSRVSAIDPVKNGISPFGDGNSLRYADPGQVASDIEELRRLLRDEIDARLALQQKFETLTQQLAGLERNSIPETNIISPEITTAGGNTEANKNQDWFNEQALLDAGMNNNQASELRNYFEQLEMERLNIRDQSVRENWNREQFREVMQTISSREDELRDRLSDSDYDAYLYATGKPNRIAVTSVLASAQAATAGIQAGDHIIRYDDQRIHDWHELRAATAGGNINDAVPLEVIRDGKTMHFYVARGPLGIRMDAVSVAPSNRPQ